MKKMRFCVYPIIMILLNANFVDAQTYVFAKLQGVPVNTDGWNFTGAATAGSGADNDKILLCPNALWSAGSVFYNKPINLSVCSNWSAEFDFRIYDGTRADGIAFCFLDVPPSGFVAGAGLGIPGTANGLKVCFDQYPNCAPYTFDRYPKIEIRYGVGYNECTAQPTIDNSAGNLSFIYSTDYKHAKITYNNGNISVYVNNTLYLTGFQEFNFSGYIGFCAGTGSNSDNHTIKNVIIYADMPPSVAGAAVSICSGETVQLGAANSPKYVYNWTPANGLSATDIANPSTTLTNTSDDPVSQKYYVNTSFYSSPGCFSSDSVVVTVNALPAITITSSANNICSGIPVTFNAVSVHGGSAPVYQWKKNGFNVGSNATSYTSNNLRNGDVISCVLTTSVSCSGTHDVASNDIKMIISSLVTPSLSISASANSICRGTSVSFTAVPVNGGTAPKYQWQVNGDNVGTNSPAFTSDALANSDIITCTLTSNSSCATTAMAASNIISMSVKPIVTPSVKIVASANNICPGNAVVFTATPVNGGNNPVYQWKVNGMNLGPNSTDFTSVVLVNDDVVYCEMTSNASCTSIADTFSNSIKMVVNRSPVPSVSIRASDSSICVGDEVSFTATAINGGASPVYQWKQNGTNIGTNSAFYTGNSLTNGAVIECQLTSNAGCVTRPVVLSENITMAVLTPPSISITASKNTICAGDPVIFSATAAGAGTSPGWQWKLNGTDIGTNKSWYTNNNFSNSDQVACVLTPGAGSCSSKTVTSNTERIVINPLPGIVISPADTIVLAGSQVQLNASSPAPLNSYQWLPLSGLNNPASLSPVTFPLNSVTDYLFKAKTINGCPVSKTVTIRVYQNLFIPKAFTPDQNGLNDVFRIPPNVSLTLKNFSIYDRWSRKIFSTENINEGWDGTFNGARQPGGAYIYIICGHDTKGPVLLKGSFILIR